jgi:ribosomal-protein-alanine N-acetyltransferase
MIREASNQDILRINEIGLLIKDDFNKVFNIEEDLKKDYVHIYVYEENNQILGFLHTEYHFEITDIVNIAVDINNQNKGIGYKLIDYLLNNTESKKIMLEVRESNTNAISLYNKCGFKEIHRRVNYYGNEDAIIMERGI